MPFGDKTGPEGRGPMTGRQSGYCAGNDRPGSYEPRFGRGLGRGRGFFGGLGSGRRGVRQFFGRGFNSGRFNNFYQPEFEEEIEETALKSQADYLKQQLEQVSGRLSKLMSAKKQD